MLWLCAGHVHGVYSAGGGRLLLVLTLQLQEPGWSLNQAEPSKNLSSAPCAHCELSPLRAACREGATTSGTHHSSHRARSWLGREEPQNPCWIWSRAEGGGPRARPSEGLLVHAPCSILWTEGATTSLRTFSRTTGPIGTGAL